MLSAASPALQFLFLRHEQPGRARRRPDPRSKSRVRRRSPLQRVQPHAAAAASSLCAPRRCSRGGHARGSLRNALSSHPFWAPAGVASADILIAGHREERGTSLALLHRFLGRAFAFSASISRARSAVAPYVRVSCVCRRFVAQGDEPRPPSLAAAAPRRRRPPPPLAAAAAPRRRRCPHTHTRALGWAAVSTSRGRCPRRRGSCEEKREDGAVLLIAGELRQTRKLSRGRSSVGFVEAQENAHFQYLILFENGFWALSAYLLAIAGIFPTPLTCDATCI